ncbi:transcription antiterminator [Enterococcus sp. MJM12]|uniref:Transcription antiterminator n=1 Tax=Candidatus Enterococcus myersii TaxID=2815322 RepID=A0ABS3H5L0_9ENTE|nr:BglG family transcription antiterminator [Enterococcus sp. MJM12]MBO0448746.1 transcription antiterminator [Enterococcus sp. MJM12]
MLSRRQKELVEVMLQQERFQTVDFFANKLGVSKRTVHSELKAIEPYISSSGMFLEKKRGVGIALKNLKEVGFEQDTDDLFDEYSLVTRRIEIMEMLLFDQEITSFNQLSDQFLVSKTSIKNDLTLIMKILQVGNHLNLVSDLQGTRLSGSEEDFQKGLLQFNRYLISNFDIFDDGSVHENVRLLERYYGENLVSACSNILYTYVRDNVNAISDYYIQNILSIFIILVYRLKKNKHFNQSNIQKNQKNNRFYKKSAESLLSKAANRLKIQFNDSDVEFLSQHLISNRFESLPDESVDRELVDKLISKVSESLKVQLSDDVHLEEQLRNHIPPMLYRLKSNNKTENPFTSQIKKEFSLTFNVIWVVLSEYESEVGISFNEDEIAFLTMYFQAAIERAKLNKRILIVCQMGIATSELLINRIKSILPSLDKLEVASAGELRNLNIESYDLIISTIKLELQHHNILYVSPFLNEEDMNKISKYSLGISKQNTTKNNKKIRMLNNFIYDDEIYFNTNFSSREELIESIGSDLEKKGYIQTEFIKSVLNRENLGGTDLPSGTSVPHGNSLYVNKTVIAIIKNKKKMKWNEYFVDVIFLICIASEDTKKIREILSDIYQILDNPTKLTSIRNIKNKQLLLDVIKE